MLILKGTSCRFEMEDGKTVRTSGGMLHDPNGKAWGRCSVLFGPFTRGREPVSKDLGARQYFGADYNASLGSADIPDERTLSAWTEVGKVARIYYVRVGNVYGGQLFQHPFKRKPTLYKLGRWYRLELGTFCVLNARGYVSP